MPRLLSAILSTPVSAYTFLASVRRGMPANSGRPVGDPMVVVVVDVVVVEAVVVDVVVVDVDSVVVDVVDATVVEAGVARGDDEHPAATTNDTTIKATGMRSTGQS